MSTIQTKTMRAQRRHKGAALLMAVLISGVILSVGIGVYQRTYKQLVFASFWKQMQIAFSAANSGMECAMYWDLHPATPSCFGLPYSSWTTRNWIPGNTTGNFEVNTSGGCSIVTITKNNTWPFTIIVARGYNGACGSTSLRRVERGLMTSY